MGWAQAFLSGHGSRIHRSFCFNVICGSWHIGNWEKSDVDVSELLATFSSNVKLSSSPERQG